MRTNFFSFVASCTVLFTPCFLVGFANAQITATSPNSSFGMGQREGMDHAVFAGLGNTSITYCDSTTLNFFNPASYNLLGKGQPLFSVGLSSRLSTFQEGGSSYFAKAIILNHYAMGFSFAKNFGVAVGLKPFTRRGYGFSSRSMVGTDTLKHQYNGSGSSNEVFLGLTSHLFKLKKQQLSIGGNVGYVFGSLTNERRSNIVGVNFGGIDQNILKLNALHYELGLHYQQKIDRKNNFAVSAVIEPQQNLGASQQWNLFTSSFVDNPLYYSKIDSSGVVPGTVILAPSTTVGFRYSFSFEDAKKEGKMRHSEISFHSSYNWTNWSEFKTDFGGSLDSPGYQNTTKFTVGLQYIPEVSFLGQSAKSALLEIMRFRMGYYHYALPLQIGGKTVTDKGVSFGIGLPVRAQKSVSSVNLGVTYGNRGNGLTESLSERYYGINLSVIFAPANFERWFIKRKFD
jgi:hypothetical protein